jgi:histidyl-tRNA synthetase
MALASELRGAGVRVELYPEPDKLGKQMKYAGEKGIPFAAILGGDEIGQDGGYGPARLLNPNTVRAVADALDALDVETLRARFDPAAMAAADIYPDIWTNGADEFDSYLMPNLTELRRFYHAAAGNGQAVLLAIT